MSTQEGRVRTSDAEREQVIEALRAAVGEGRLTLEEGDARMASAYEAKYRDELRPLTADLPGGGWEALTRTPEAFHAMRRRLRLHGVGTIAVAGLLITAWVLSGAHFFWPLIPLIILGFSFARHARFVRYLRMARGGVPWFLSQGGRGASGHGPWGHGPWGRGPWGQGWGDR